MTIALASLHERPIAPPPKAGSSTEENAAFYSLLGTAKLNSMNPEHHLRYDLTSVADHRLTASQNSCAGTSCRQHHHDND